MSRRLFFEIPEKHATIRDTFGNKLTCVSCYPKALRFANCEHGYISKPIRNSPISRWLSKIHISKIVVTDVSVEHIWDILLINQLLMATKIEKFFDFFSKCSSCFPISTVFFQIVIINIHGSVLSAPKLTNRLFCPPYTLLSWVRIGLH